MLWLDSPLGLVVSSFSGAVFGSGLPGCISLFPALAKWRFFPLGTPYLLKCAKNNVSMKQWKLISQWWNHQTSKNLKLQTEDFQHAESKKYVTILSLWSLSGTLRLLYHHLEWVICSGWCALITFGGGYKTWPSEQCSSVWTLLTSSVLRLCSTNSSILSGIMNHSECCRLVHHPAVDRSSLTATPSSFTFGLHDFWWNRWCIFNKLQSYLSDQSGLTCFSCPNWIKCVCVFF